LRADPTLPLRAIGLKADDWQARLARSAAAQITVLCCRRAGKSRTVAARVLVRCLTRPRFLALIFNPTQRQSMEFLDYVREMNMALGFPVPLVRESRTELAWANGSRAVSMPDSPKGSVGFTPSLLVLDEGSRISDQLYMSVRPMLVLGQAEVIALSTPFGKRGWFHGVWSDPDRLAFWEQYKVTAADCPRISRAAIEQDRAEMGDLWWRQEYLCEFVETANSVFSHDDVMAALAGWTEPGPAA
jgi:hypothetical protein